MNTTNNNIQKKPQSLQAWLMNDKVNESLTKTLADKKQQFTSNLLSMVEQDQLLAQCEPKALVNVAMAATALDLPLNKNFGYAYIIPYKNNKKGIYEPQFQIGYKGYIQLALRSGNYKKMNVVEVREGEMKRNKFTDEVEFLEEQPNNEVIGYLAFFKDNNGFEKSEYMSTEQMIAFADEYSMSFKKDIKEQIDAGKIAQKEMWKYSSPWYSKFDEMAKKTVIKKLLKTWGMLSVEMQQAIEKDQSNDKGEYIDNQNVIKIDPEVVQAPKFTEPEVLETPTPKTKVNELSEQQQNMANFLDGNEVI